MSAGLGLFVCLFACPLVQVQALSCYFADVSKIVLMLMLFGALPAFSCSSLGALALNMALFRVFRAFLGGFICLVWVYVGCVLCVACGAFVCVSG